MGENGRSVLSDAGQVCHEKRAQLSATMLKTRKSGGRTGTDRIVGPGAISFALANARRHGTRKSDRISKSSAAMSSTIRSARSIARSISLA
jgi:hypothetical protein